MKKWKTQTGQAIEDANRADNPGIADVDKADKTQIADKLQKTQMS